MPVTGIAAPESPPPAGPVQPSSANASTAGAIASINAGAITTSTQINSLDNLKNLDPDIYYKMMTSMGQNICQEWQQREEKRRKIKEEYEQG